MAELPDRGAAQRLLATFRRIHRERMAGLPILNPRLEVAVLEGRVWGDDWTGILLTPWLMSLVALPSAESAPGWLAGTERTLELPAGRLTLAVATEPDLGPYAACSLFSPMGEFPDQETALIAARAALAALFVPAGHAAAAAERSRGISRRDLLRGGRGRA